MKSCWNCQRDLSDTATECFGCGVAASSVIEVRKTNELAAGAVLSGRYELKRKLGQGGMGQVWLAEDCVREEPVAIKLVTRELARDRAAAAGFKREANLSLKLTHPYIVRLINYEIQPFPYLLMEFLNGKNLWEEMTSRGRGPNARLTVEEMARLLPNVAEALDYAHRQNVQHRDIKPSNLLLDGPISTGSAKLADFGIAAELREGVSGGISGTPEYMAPEQHARRKVDRRADLYSFGVTVYNLLAGKLPFRNANEVMTVTPPQIPGLSMSQQLALARMLAVDPEQRPESALDFCQRMGFLSAATAQARAAVVSASAPAVALSVSPASQPGYVTSPAAIGWAGSSSQPPQGTPLPTPSIGGFSSMRTPHPFLAPRSMPTPNTVRAEPVDDSISLEREPREFTDSGAEAVLPPLHKLIGANPQGCLECISPRDGAVLTLIPRGKFTMGSSIGGADEQPTHEVTLPDFWIDRIPVTNKMFESFVRATGYITTAEQIGKGFAFDGRKFTIAIRGASWRHPLGPTDSVASRPDHPVVQMSWVDANAYAAWANRRLPTEAEWERAARGGHEGKTYPWGEAPPLGRAWFLDSACNSVMKVGAFPPNGYGLEDVAGNIWEWVEDWYDDTVYHRRATGDFRPVTNGRLRVLRGGAWYVSETQLRCAYRFKGDPLQGNAAQGFRLAVSVKP